jgi:hypothetical protein
VSFDHGELSINYWAREVGLSNKYYNTSEKATNQTTRTLPSGGGAKVFNTPHEKAEHKHLGPMVPQKQKS